MGLRVSAPGDLGNTQDAHVLHGEDQAASYWVPQPRVDEVVAALSGNHVFLRPVRPVDYDYLYNISTAPENLLGWRFRGSPPSPEAFAQRLWAGVLCQFVVSRVQAGEGRDGRIGLVVAYNPDLRNRTTSLALLVDPRVSRRGWVIESLLIFIDHLFTSWDLRKLYLEALEFNYARFSSGAGQYFEVEGCMKGHEYHDGRYWHKYLLSIDRPRWLAVKQALSSFGG